LGDIHNLFGDTDAATVRVLGDGSAALEQFKRGDSCDVMLDYVGYDLAKLREAYRDKIAAANVDAGTAALFEQALETGLTGYTYLAE
jgi:arginine decarboxylase